MSIQTSFENLGLTDTGVVRGACPHDCPDTCAMLVTVENGRAIRVAGDPDHPVTKGFLCAKVNRYVERTYHDYRLTTPMRRAGPKGSGKFEAITWDAALEEIATRLGDIARSSDGPEARGTGDPRGQEAGRPRISLT